MRVENMAAGRATIVPIVQMSDIPTRRVLWDLRGASGVIMACTQTQPQLVIVLLTS